MHGSASAVNSCLDSESRVLDRYFTKNPQLGLQGDCDGLIAQLLKPVNPNELIDENIQKKKFNEAQRRRAELEDRLKKAQDEVNMLELSPGKGKNNGKSKKPKMTKAEDLENENKESRDAFVAKMRKEQAQREKIQKENQERWDKRIEDEEAVRKHLADKTIEDRKIAARKKAIRSQELIEDRAEEREAKLKESKHNLWKAQNSQTTHDKIATDYYTKVRYPADVEKEKILKKIKEDHKSITIDELRRHDAALRAKQEEDKILRKQRLKQRHPKDPNYGYFESKFKENYQKEEKEIQDKKRMQKAESERIINRKRNYSQLVKELHFPSKDPSKVLESAGRLDVGSHGRKTSATLGLTKKEYMEQISFQNNTSKSSRSRQMFKSNPMLPPVKVQRTGASIDFLAARREERAKVFQENDDRTETPPIAKTKTLQKKIQQKNLLLNELRESQKVKELLDNNQTGKIVAGLVLGHMQDEKFIKTNEKVGDMLLKSVKNKLDEFHEYLV